MTINPNTAEYGFPYLVEYQGAEWTGFRHRQVSTSMNPNADLVIDTADTTSWIFLAQGDAGEVIAERHPHAKGEDFGKIVPLVPARNVTRDDLPPLAEVETLVEQAPWGTSTVDVVLDAVVAHLNENGGVPDSFNLSAEKLNASGDVQPKSCCEEAALNAAEVDRLKKLNKEFMDLCNNNATAAKDKAFKLSDTAAELARRNEELSEKQEEIAELTKRVEKAEARVNEVEANNRTWRKKAQRVRAKLRAAETKLGAPTVHELVNQRDDARAKNGEIMDRLMEVNGEWNEMRKDRNGQKARAEKAEAERDELQAACDKAWKEAEVWRKLWAKVANLFIAGTNEQGIEELQAKLDAAENRPTLDRDTVYRTVIRETHGGLPTDRMDNALTDAIMALVPAAEGWPEWLGPRPEKPNAFRNSNGAWAMDRTLIAADITPEQCDRFIEHHINTAIKYAAVKDATESEQAATGDEDQRVEEQAKALRKALYPGSVPWECLSPYFQNAYRSAIRAGWTPPNPSAKGDGLDRTTDGGRVESEDE